MMRSVLLCSALSLGSSSALLGQAVAAYHDASLATHQNQTNVLTANGYRPISVTIYGTAANPQFGAVWVQRPGPAFLPFHGLTEAQYQALVVANQATYAPTIVSACGAGANARLAGVLEQTGYSPWARHGQTRAQFDTEVQLARSNGWRIASADLYGTNADPRYLVTFRPNPEQVGWGYYHANGVQGHQDLFDGIAQAYVRPISVGCTDDSSRFLCVWEDTIVGQVVAHHDLTSAQYDTLANQYYANDNRYPFHLTAGGDGSGARFAALWATTDVPQARQWSATGTLVPELAGFDQWVQNWMQTNNIRGASLAVAKDGELKLARGYTWAEPGYALVQPTSGFRIASCTKPLCSIVVHQQIQRTPAQLDYTTPMAALFGNPTFADARCNQIDLEHLLTHQGGWDRSANGSNIDPMFLDATIATALNIPLPVSATDIRTYMQNQPLDFTPGTASVYSNYGFNLLARGLEQLNPGKSFPQLLQERVFRPLGITRPRVGRSLAADRLPGEVLYHPRAMGVAQTVVDPDRPWVPGHYGGWNQENMDGHGAWVMTAPDFAKVLAAFDLGPFNPILGPTQTTAMWTLAPGASFLKGWWINGASTSSVLREHNGVLPGSRAYVGRRADGISFVFFANGDQPLGGAEGAAFSALADGVSVWPAHDLFPAVGIPSFQRIDDLMVPFGTDCPGTLGPARLTGIGSSDIGQRAGFQLDLAMPDSVAFCCVGYGQGLFDLGVYGAPGCALQVTPASSELLLTDALGRAAWFLDLPLVPELVGTHLFVQDAVLDPRANLLGLYVTRGVDLTIGGWLGG